MTRFASKVSQRKKLPVRLSMQNIHHCNQWNTSFLFIRYNGFANAYFWWYYSSKTYIDAIWINFFNKLLRKTQISLGIRPVWSDSLLCAQWVAKGSVPLQGDAQADLSLRWAHSQGFIEKETGVTWKKLIVNIFSWFLYQMKELKKCSLPRRYKTMSENA